MPPCARLFPGTSHNPMRLDFERIASFIPSGGTVLDLGCGGGDMLSELQKSHGVDGVGADINTENLTRCLQKGVQAVHCDIARELNLFGDGAFDIVVLSDTLQSIQTPPQQLLAEMLRIGKTAVVSFPNFGYWRLRSQILAGKMPVGRALPQEWHTTQNVRYCTIRDFELLCRKESLSVRERVFLRGEEEVAFAPNLRAETAIYHLTRGN